ncbi:hypothetical protein [Neotamlana sedimentorum]|uniref:hypothetical protein n=1 Tax=Neotamlana sedimentorum TaxID=1435349 RepID=UPI001969B706
MWDTKTTDFNIMNTPYRKDIVKDYVFYNSIVFGRYEYGYVRYEQLKKQIK